MAADRGAEVERRIVSVLFADLVGFAELAERLDPEDLATVQDAYFGAARETVSRYGGSVEKFIGDAVMAVFGLPRTRDDDAERGVRAGLAMISAVDQLAVRVGLDEGALRLRVGVTTGEVVHSAGSADSGTGEGRVSGDVVNTAARLQAVAPAGGVLVDDTTALAVADTIELGDLTTLELKGKAARVRVRRVVGARAVASRDLAMGGLRAPLLGREADVRRLTEALDRARDGKGEHWLVVAPPGVGKTRLLDAFAERAMSAQLAPWRIRLRAEAGAPYEPIRDLVRAALAAAGLDPDRLPGLLEAAGESAARGALIAERVGRLLVPGEPAAAGEAGRPTHDRDDLFAAWLQALNALAGGSTQLWLVEDVHWAGPDLLAFLAAADATTEPPRSGRLIVATARPSILESAPAFATEDPSAGRFIRHLPTLEPAAAGQLVRALVGDSLPPELVERIAERSDGNPLFIEELVRTWVSVGTLVATDLGAWRLTIGAADVPLPRSVQQIYGAQLDDLPPAARLAARRASVAGRRFPLRVLERLGVPRAADAVEQLRRRAFVAGPNSEPLTGDTFAYRHALLRDAGYASLARAERARLHVELARWLEGVAGKRRAEIAETIGSHYAAALESAPALATEVAPGLDRRLCAALAAEWLEQAAVAALDLSAHAAAVNLATRALGLTSPDELLARARRTELLADSAAAASDLGDALDEYRRGAGIYRQARLGAAGADDVRSARDGLARVTQTMGDLLCDRLRFGEARDLASRVLAELEEARDVATARLLLLRGRAASASGDRTTEPMADVQRGLDIALRLGDPELEMLARSHLAGVRAELGIGTIDDHLALREAAERHGDWRRALNATTNVAMWLLDDRVDEAWATIDAAARTAEAHGLPETLAWTDYLSAEAGFRSGDWDRAMAAGTRAIEVAERNGYHRVAVRTWFVVTAIAAARGDQSTLEHAQRWFRAHEDGLPGSPYGLMTRAAVDLRLADAGLIALVIPEPAELAASLREDFASPSWIEAVLTVVERWAVAGMDVAAREAVAIARHVRDESPGGSRFAFASLDLAEAMVHRDAGRARGALLTFRQLGAPWWSLRGLRTLAALVAAGPEELAEASAIEGRLDISGR